MPSLSPAPPDWYLFPTVVLHLLHCLTDISSLPIGCHWCPNTCNFWLSLMAQRVFVGGEDWPYYVKSFHFFVGHTREPYVLKQLIARRALGVLRHWCDRSVRIPCLCRRSRHRFVPINGSDGDRVRNTVRELLWRFAGNRIQTVRVLRKCTKSVGSISGSENRSKF